MKLRGRVTLVTGGAKRIGRRVAMGLAQKGCHVAITYRTSQREAAETVRAIRALGVRGLAVQVDQRDPSQVERGMESILKTFRRLDILVNNASSFYPTPWAKVTEGQWEDLISTNLTGPWRFSRAAGEIMKRQGGGKIVNIVDAAVFRPWEDYLPYCAAKGGLMTLTWGMARALAPEVQVNAIAPGPILFPSDLTDSQRRKAIEKTLLKRPGSPEDILKAVLFFVEGSNFVTGVVLPVEGGRLLA